MRSTVGMQEKRAFSTEFLRESVFHLIKEEASMLSMEESTFVMSLRRKVKECLGRFISRISALWVVKNN